MATTLLVMSHGCHTHNLELPSTSSTKLLVLSHGSRKGSRRTPSRHWALVQARRAGPPDTLDHGARREARRQSRMVPTEELGRKKHGTNGVANGNPSGALPKFVPKKRSGGAATSNGAPVTRESSEFKWARHSYNAVQRTVDIWVFVAALRLRVMHEREEWMYYPGGFTRERQSERRRRTAAWLREQLLQLGPTFIKFGQFFSTRSDLIPEEYVAELAKLQDKVPAFSHEEARSFIERELGAPIHALFKEFEDKPIAAASLGQVHRAVLYNGEKVVVKVQRPGLRKLFDIDLRNMKLLAEYFQRHENFGGPKRNWLAIYDDCSKLLYQEIDYINEGKNADRFCRDFRNIKWVRVPFVYWDYTSMKVLTLEYVPGIKINDLASLDGKGYNRSRIASSAIESYLIQILKTGFFHADPHPGNLAIDKDGSLVYYDFGMMGEIKSFTRERLLQLFFAVYENDVKKIARCLVTLEVVQPTEDLSSVEKSIKLLLNSLANQTAGRQESLAAIREDLLGAARDQPIYFPSTFIYVMKAFTTMEGIGYILDPQFSFGNCAAPYIQDLISTRQRQIGGAELVEDIRKQANEAGNYALSLPYRIQQIEDFTKQLESGDLKLRVRVYESERAAKKASMLQMATIYMVLGGILLNVAVTLSSQGIEAIANGCIIGASILWMMSIRSMRKVQKLDDRDRNL